MIMYNKQNFIDGQILTHEHLNNIESGIANITSCEQFTDFETKTFDFLLKVGTNDKGESKMFMLKSTTNNARCAVFSLRKNHTYNIYAKNNSTNSSHYRARIGVFKEKYSDIIVVPAGRDDVTSIDSTLGTPAAEILINDNTNEYIGTYTNTNGYNTLIIMIGWGVDYSLVDISVIDKEYERLNKNIKITIDNINEDTRKDITDPWSLKSNRTLSKQDYLTLSDILTSNMCKQNKATQNIMELAYDFWKRRDEFIYCNGTARDNEWDYWATDGYYDVNTGETVSAENAGWKRIDCSTFAYYVTNGIGYYSSPYYNTLEWTDVVKGKLANGIEEDTDDETICRTGKMYVRPEKKLILESKDSSKYYFTGIYGYKEDGTLIQTFENISINQNIIPSSDVCYIRAEMKVTKSSDYTPKVETVPRSPAKILKLLRIRENEQLKIHGECPSNQRYAKHMCKWYDDNGYGMTYNRWVYRDSDFPVGSIMWWGRTTSPNNYKYITHISVYIGSGYLIHSSTGGHGLKGGEGIHIQSLAELFDNYTQPLVSVASPKYHNDYTIEKELYNIN